jgi:cysteine-rich repeat protein
LLVATDRDSDGDELPDRFDNCSEIPNVDQSDLDGDAVGDACDLQTCGNAIAEGSEACDDGNPDDDDACKGDCSANTCSDGFVRAGVEACDDGNAVTADGCSTGCEIEPCYDCAGDPSLCSATTAVFGTVYTGCVPASVATATCEQSVAKALATLTKRVMTCQGKAVKALFKGSYEPADKEACEAKARARFDATTLKLIDSNLCPACLDGAHQGVLRSAVEDRIGAGNGAIYCSPGTPLGGGDTGFAPPAGEVGAAELKCEAKVAKQLVNLRAAITKCRSKAAAALLAGSSFDGPGCEATAIGKFDAASSKLELSGGCPACLSAANRAALRNAAVAELNRHNGDVYCQP